MQEFLHKTQIKDAQEVAKNLITESIAYFESVSDVKKIAAARAKLFIAIGVMEN